MGLLCSCANRASASDSARANASTKSNSEYMFLFTKDVWQFKHGTLVQGPCTFHECVKKMWQTTSNIDSFYASHIIDNLYEVQFEKTLYPSVLVIVSAESGLEAGTRAQHSLAKDYALLELIASSYIA